MQYFRTDNNASVDYAMMERSSQSIKSTGWYGISQKHP